MEKEVLDATYELLMKGTMIGLLIGIVAVPFRSKKTAIVSLAVMLSSYGAILLLAIFN